MFKLRQVSLLAVALALAACSSEDKGGPAGVMALRGGAGTTGAGGSGGWVWVGSGGGDVSVRPGGSMPTLPGWKFDAPALGANPLTISKDTLLGVNGPLVGDDGVNAATGLWVKRGATLTLYSSDESSPGYLFFTLEDALVVDGTLVLAQVGDRLDATGIDAEVGAVSISGRLDASGGDTDGEFGGDGGSVYLRVAGDCFVSGKVVTRGGDGRNGGNGGDVDFTVEGPYAAGETAPTPGTISVSGTIDTSGGDGSAGYGGDAGYNDAWGVWSAQGACNAHVSGDMIARGGAGAAGGGWGGSIYVSSCWHGWAAFTGLLDTSGGDATAAGDGGHADQQQFESSGGKVYANGTMRARGGRGAGDGAGGYGAWVGIFSSERAGLPTGAHVAARFEVEGGGGATGGGGGAVEIYSDHSAVENGGVHLHGYASIDAAGGDGASGGGGGDVEIMADAWWDGARYLVGTAVNEADVDVRGGRGLAGNGGGGGSVEVSSYGIETADDTAREVHAMGEIHAQGGDGTVAGGSGGDYYCYDATMLHVTGPVNVSGGSGGTGVGGDAGWAEFGSGGEVNLRAAVTANGGASASSNGGAGGPVFSYGEAARLETVTADGGAAPLGIGGGGGYVSLSSNTPPSVVGGTVSLRGGPGATPGDVGSFWRDEVLVGLVNGRFVP